MTVVAMSWRRAPSSAASGIKSTDAPSTEATTESEGSTPPYRPPPPPPPPQRSKSKGEGSSNKLLRNIKSTGSSGRPMSRRGSATTARGHKSSGMDKKRRESTRSKKRSSSVARGRARSVPPTRTHAFSRSRSRSGYSAFGKAISKKNLLEEDGDTDVLHRSKRSSENKKPSPDKDQSPRSRSVPRKRRTSTRRACDVSPPPRKKESATSKHDGKSESKRRHSKKGEDVKGSKSSSAKQRSSHPNTKKHSSSFGNKPTSHHSSKRTSSDKGGQHKLHSARHSSSKKKDCHHVKKDKSRSHRHTSKHKGVDEEKPTRDDRRAHSVDARRPSSQRQRARSAGPLLLSDAARNARSSRSLLPPEDACSVSTRARSLSPYCDTSRRSSPSSTSFPVDSHIILQDLQSWAHLNGKRGIVKSSLDATSGRQEVYIVDVQQVTSVKPANMRYDPLEPSPSPRRRRSISPPTSRKHRSERQLLSERPKSRDMRQDRRSPPRRSKSFAAATTTTATTPRRLSDRSPDRRRNESPVARRRSKSPPPAMHRAKPVGATSTRSMARELPQVPSTYRPETRSAVRGGERCSKLSEVSSGDHDRSAGTPSNKLDTRSSTRQVGDNFGRCKISGASSSDDEQSLGNTAKTPCSQFKENKGGEDEGFVESMVEPSRRFQQKDSQAPPPKQGSLRRSLQDLTGRVKSGTKRHAVPPPPPPPPRSKLGGCKSLVSSGTPITAPETATNSSPTEDPSVEQLTSATARMRGLKRVANLMYSDRLGGYGKYSGELDQFGRPHGHGEMKYDNGKSYRGGFNNGVPNAAEFQRQNPPPVAVVQYTGPPQPTYATGGAMSVAPGMSFAPGMSVTGGGPASVFSGMTQSRGSLVYTGGSVASPHMFGAANVARAQSMYGNPYLQRSVSVPMICYHGGPGMPQHQQQPGMNPQQLMMVQQGMANTATPMQSMHPQGR